jgi:predicted nucleic acid-binding protein
MTRFLPDTSVMIAAVCSWHEHHAPAARDLEHRLARRETLIVAAPALIEAYAVLTRLPSPHRLSPTDARALLEANFLAGKKLVALEARDYRALLEQAPAQGVSGGRTYDWVIALCATKAKASVLLTLNPRDFESFVTERLEVRVPSGPAA